MARKFWLPAMAVVAALIVFLFTAGRASAQPNTYTDLGVHAGPNGSSLHWYSVAGPDDCYGAISTQQADGSLRTQFYRTRAEYEAALRTVGTPLNRDETTSVENERGEKAVQESAALPAGIPTSSTSRTCVQGLWWAGYRWNSLTTVLTWTYNATSVTSRSRTASSGIRSPWTWYGSSTTTWSPSTLPASYTLLDVFQAYCDVELGVTYYNVLRNKTRAYGNGSSSWSESVFGIDSRLSGWTHTIGDS